MAGKVLPKKVREQLAGQAGAASALSKINSIEFDVLFALRRFGYCLVGDKPNFAIHSPVLDRCIARNPKGESCLTEVCCLIALLVSCYAVLYQRIRFQMFQTRCPNSRLSAAAHEREQSKAGAEGGDHKLETSRVQTCDLCMHELAKGSRMVFNWREKVSRSSAQSIYMIWRFGCTKGTSLDCIGQRLTLTNSGLEEMASFQPIGR